MFVDPLGHCQDAAKFFPISAGLLLHRKTLGVQLALEMFKGNGSVTKPAGGVKKITFYVRHTLVCGDESMQKPLAHPHPTVGSDTSTPLIALMGNLMVMVIRAG